MRKKRSFDRDKFRVLFFNTGLTQAEFADLIERTSGSVSQYLRGAATPGEDVIYKMATALHCNVDDLLEDVASEEPILKKKTAPVREGKIFSRDKFRVLFFKSGLTKAKFADLIEKTPYTVREYLRGVYTPKGGVICKMATALHCNVDDLLEDVVSEEPIQAEWPILRKQTEEEAVAFELLMTAIELIKNARDMLKDIRKGE